MKHIIKKHALLIGTTASLLAVGGVAVGAQYLNAPSRTLQASNSYISEEQAKEIAQKHIGISDLTFTSLLLETDDDSNTPYYDIEATKDDVHYEIDVNAVTGNILSYKTSSPSTIRQQQTTSSSSQTQTDQFLSQEAIKKIVKDTTKQTDLTYTVLQLDTENGRAVYEIKAHTNSTFYELDIDAKTGTILSSKEEHLETTTTNTGQPKLSEADIKAIVTKTTGIATLTYTEFKLSQESDDYMGALVYEISAYANGTEYELDIDATTGQVLKSSAERDD